MTISWQTFKLRKKITEEQWINAHNLKSETAIKTKLSNAGILVPTDMSDFTLALKTSRSKKQRQSTTRRPRNKKSEKSKK